MTRLLAISVLGLASACSEPGPDLEAVLLSHLEARGHSAKPIDLDSHQWQGYRRALELTGNRTEEEVEDGSDPSGSWRGEAIDSLVLGAERRRSCQGTVYSGVPFAGPRVADLCRMGLNAAEHAAEQGDVDRAELIMRSLLAMNVDLIRNGDQELQMIAAYWSLFAAPLESGEWAPEKRGQQARRVGKLTPWDDPLIGELLSVLSSPSVAKELTVLRALQQADEGEEHLLEDRDLVALLQRKWALEDEYPGRYYWLARQLNEEFENKSSASRLVASDVLGLEHVRRRAVAQVKATSAIARNRLPTGLFYGMTVFIRGSEVEIRWDAEDEEPLLFVVPD